jgi:hypothetical protein
MSRGVMAVGLAIIGFILQIVSFLFLAAPWGFPPSGPEHSEPVLQFSPMIFIAGVMLVFIAGILYEVIPDRKSET